ncbi:hypothetical protein [Bacillus cereus group sp. BfR-BA-01382]|uniref:hypothetical protein n=1 Tax=Bacillus cereus group sp. BfR-BA-01382 TaxID=2920326 RepID=UPI001F5A9A8F
MKNAIIIEKMIQQIRQHAKERAKCVLRGAETPHLSGLLLQKYGCGVIDTINELYSTPRASDEIYKVLDAETVKIDPEWKLHNKQRWSGHPADICIK